MSGTTPGRRERSRWTRRRNRERARTPLDDLAGRATDLERDGLTSTGTVAICCRPAPGATFAAAREQLAIAAQPRARLVHWEWDVQGQQWALLTGDSLRRLAVAVTRVERALGRRGFESLLLWTAFGLRRPTGHTFQLVYDHRHTSFYPFAPTPDAGRDEELEAAVARSLAGHVPVTVDPAHRVGLWDSPLSRF